VRWVFKSIVKKDDSFQGIFSIRFSISIRRSFFPCACSFLLRLLPSLSDDRGEQRWWNVWPIPSPTATSGKSSRLGQQTPTSGKSVRLGQQTPTSGKSVRLRQQTPTSGKSVRLGQQTRTTSGKSGHFREVTIMGQHRGSDDNATLLRGKHNIKRKTVTPNWTPGRQNLIKQSGEGKKQEKEATDTVKTLFTLFLQTHWHAHRVTHNDTHEETSLVSLPGDLNHHSSQWRLANQLVFSFVYLCLFGPLPKNGSVAPPQHCRLPFHVFFSLLLLRVFFSSSKNRLKSFLTRLVAKKKQKRENTKRNWWALNVFRFIQRQLFLSPLLSSSLLCSSF